MADLNYLSTASLGLLFAALRADGRRLLAPTDRDGRSELNPVETPAQVAQGYIQTVMSAKAVAFPKVERLLTYTLANREVRLLDAPARAEATVVFGIRPCEAAGFAALDAVFNWDTRDRFFNARMAAMTVIGVACEHCDQACFCTSVGGGPEDRRGSDILLAPIPGGYRAELLSDKGRALRALAPELFAPWDPSSPEPHLAEVPGVFGHAELTDKLPALFESGLWAEQSLGCLGCGACAFVCPTCVCFDLQEEADAKGGQRLRTWDSCGGSPFTLHASGHNPRETQAQRWRQRVYHKFSYYPQRYGMLGCVGCGKCTRACPVDMNLQEHLVEAAQAQVNP